MNLNESWPPTCWILFVKIVPELFLDEYKPHWDKLQTWNMTNKCSNELNTIRGSAVGVIKQAATHKRTTHPKFKASAVQPSEGKCMTSSKKCEASAVYKGKNYVPKQIALIAYSITKYYKLWIINRSLEPILRLSWKARAFEKSCHPRAVLMPNVPEATALQRTEQDLTGSCLHNINPSIWFARKCHNAQTRSLPSNTDIQRRKAERKTRSKPSW